MSPLYISLNFINGKVRLRSKFYSYRAWTSNFCQTDITFFFSRYCIFSSMYTLLVYSFQEEIETVNRQYPSEPFKFLEPRWVPNLVIWDMYMFMIIYILSIMDILHQFVCIIEFLILVWSWSTQKLWRCWEKTESKWGMRTIWVHRPRNFWVDWSKPRSVILYLYWDIRFCITLP